ncbi:MAG TPA: bifunctional class I SAM-dependent methyltransferase/glycosyltransferase family 2 protein [Gaiellaceae bacterium]|nr:bifunctional class I SAM-dependent methyltransferase/glycosyltransferase family 2 protein [Gaiellaceae bacterium]
MGAERPATAVAVPAGAVAPEDAELAAFFDGFAAVEGRWRRRSRGYHDLIERIARFHVPPGAGVLEIGCGGGDLLAALRPSDGLGVDVSEGMVALARSRHPELEFVQASGELLDAGRTFDYIVLSDLVPFAYDLVALFESLRRHSHPRTRVVVNFHSQVWRPAIRLAELLRLKARKPARNWVSPDDIRNVLGLAGFEQVTGSRRVLLPLRVPFLGTAVNGFLANLWPFNHLCLTYWVVARPLPAPGEELSVSVVCPCRNEEGNIAAAVERLPEMGRGTELVFVEGGSTDGTRAEIERQIAARPERSIELVLQTGRGKGDAVRAGFAAARNDVLMILDGDLTVAPEDLPKFYRALVDGRAELVNGSRLVYDLEKGSMRFLNLLGNRVFSVLFRLIVGQPVKDTLCGTKVLHRDDYARIAAGRAYFGEFDPFGDFDLLLGAGKLGLRIVDLPVRYHARTYGTTNISRFRHGLLLLRMTAFAFWKFRVGVLRPS